MLEFEKQITERLTAVLDGLKGETKRNRAGTRALVAKKREEAKKFQESVVAVVKSEELVKVALKSKKEADKKCAERVKERKQELKRLMEQQSKAEEEAMELQVDIENVKGQILQEKENVQCMGEHAKVNLDKSWDMLGISLKKIPNKQVQCCFRCLNENDRDEIAYFSFSLVNNGRQYEVNETHPAIDGLDEMVKELNESNNIRHFVSNMREKMKASFNGRGHGARSHNKPTKEPE
eukprot:m.309817 g.309817  ORF g.309817 m.309817 type:complete len:236 (+) comp48053_c0_seq1:100-807(+)